MGEMNQLAISSGGMVELFRNPKNLTIVVVGVLALSMIAMKNGYGMEFGGNSIIRLSKNI